MQLPQRKSHRLNSWDYGQTGYYHITVCTQGKQKLLAEIHQDGIEAAVQLTPVGEMVRSHLLRMDEVSPYVHIDYHCVMPNHLHFIIIIDQPCQYSIPGLVRGFKSATTREYNKLVSGAERNTLWQSSYYDEIIRNDEMLYYVRRYIEGNPSKWLEDREYVP